MLFYCFKEATVDDKFLHALVRLSNSISFLHMDFKRSLKFRKQALNHLLQIICSFEIDRVICKLPISEIFTVNFSMPLS